MAADRGRVTAGDGPGERGRPLTEEIGDGTLDERPRHSGLDSGVLEEVAGDRKRGDHEIRSRSRGSVIGRPHRIVEPERLHPQG